MVLVQEDSLAGCAHGYAEPVAERRDGPLDDVLGGRQLELGADVGDQLAELLGRAALGVGALEVAGGRVVERVIGRLLRVLPGSGRIRPIIFT